ncbi:MAG: ABC transporter ATP-binding protein [Pseudomonadota bacterium]
MTASLTVEGLTKRFGGLVAVNDISLSATPGQIYSVIGPNGAGKSTLFKLISGFETPTSGKVWIGDDAITGWEPHRIASKGLVRTFQENTIFAGMTPLEAVSMAQHHRRSASVLGLLFGTKAARSDNRTFTGKAMEILEKVGLSAATDQPCAALPHGHLRLLGIAVALAVGPRILLLDEPFAGLNHTETSQGMALIRQLADEGLTIILVEHDIRAVMAISDRILVLNFGSIVAEGRPNAIQNDPAVIEAYLGVSDEELAV